MASTRQAGSGPDRAREAELRRSGKPRSWDRVNPGFPGCPSAASASPLLEPTVQCLRGSRLMTNNINEGPE